MSAVQNFSLSIFSFSCICLYCLFMDYDIHHFDIPLIGQRLDSILVELIPNVSRAQIQDWIKQGLVTDSNTREILKSSYKAKKPFSITVKQPVLAPFAPPRAELRSDSLNIIYEDEYLLVINKPVGLTVHPGAGQRDGTLVNMLLGHTNGRLSDIGTHERPGIVHRLDKNTSGLLVVAKTNPVHNALAEMLQQRVMKRIYQAIVYNVPSPREGTVNSMIGRDPNNRQRMAVVTQNGKDATTHYSTLQSFGLTFSLVECRLETGRTHQIRVHMALINCPVVGDTTYAGRHNRRKKDFSDETIEAIGALPGQALHAKQLIFPHPVSGELMSFDTEVPPHFQRLLDTL